MGTPSGFTIKVELTNQGFGLVIEQFLTGVAHLGEGKGNRLELGLGAKLRELIVRHLDQDLLEFVAYGLELRIEGLQLVG